jgi:hypothetical protein
MRMKLTRVTQAEATRLLGFPAPAAGVFIPYFDLAGKPTGIGRIRFDPYTDPWAKTLGRKPMRYAQTGPGVHIYFLPLNKGTWQKDIAPVTSIPLIITEGEAKAAKTCQEGFMTIGLGGVTMWHLKGQRRLHPDLALFNWGNRQVSICFDSDAETNKLVKAQEFALTAVLIDAGARVKIVRLPEVGA